MSGKIVGYKMVAGSVHYELAENVNLCMADGWKLYGTPFASNGVLYQAMVKEVYHNNKEARR